MALVSFGIFLLFQRYSVGKVTMSFSLPGVGCALAKKAKSNKHTVIRNILVIRILFLNNRLKSHSEFIPVSLWSHSGIVLEQLPEVFHIVVSGGEHDFKQPFFGAFQEFFCC